MQVVVFTDGKNNRVVPRGTTVDKALLVKEWECEKSDITYFVCEVTGEELVLSARNREQFSHPTHGRKTAKRWKSVVAEATKKALVLRDEAPPATTPSDKEMDEVAILRQLLAAAEARASAAEAQVNDLETQLVEAYKVNQTFSALAVEEGWTVSDSMIVEVGVEVEVGANAKHQETAVGGTSLPPLLVTTVTDPTPAEAAALEGLPELRL